MNMAISYQLCLCCLMCSYLWSGCNAIHKEVEVSDTNCHMVVHPCLCLLIALSCGTYKSNLQQRPLLVDRCAR